MECLFMTRLELLKSLVEDFGEDIQGLYKLPLEQLDEIYQDLCYEDDNCWDGEYISGSFYCDECESFEESEMCCY